MHLTLCDLLSQIARRRRAHQEENPDANVISLGIGDTTEPIPPAVADALAAAAKGLGTRDGYSGYTLILHQTLVYIFDCHPLENNRLLDIVLYFGLASDYVNCSERNRHSL